MSNKLIIAFDGIKESDIESGGLSVTIGFDRLRNIISNSASVAIGDDEKISGFVIDESGIKVRIVKR